MPSAVYNTTHKLGKRKRDHTSTVISRQDLTRTADSQTSASSSSEDEKTEDSNSDSGAAREAFQRAFEKRFGPLEDNSHSAKQPTSARSNHDRIHSSAEEEIEDWDGIDSESNNEESAEDIGNEDDVDEESKIEIVHHINHNTEDIDEWTQRQEKRSFMSSRPPRTAHYGQRPKETDGDDDDDPKTAHALAKNDLELSRLIRESNILQPTSTTLGTVNPSTKTRTDLQTRQRMLQSRLAALGAKDSVLEQKNVPRNIRVGKHRAREERDEKRRREAKENGVVLEKKAAVDKRKGAGMREKSVGNPSVGKFKGGMLSIAEKDVKRLSSRRPALPTKGRFVNRRRGGFKGSFRGGFGRR